MASGWPRTTLAGCQNDQLFAQNGRHKPRRGKADGNSRSSIALLVSERVDADAVVAWIGGAAVRGVPALGDQVDVVKDDAVEREKGERFHNSHIHHYTNPDRFGMGCSVNLNTTTPSSSSSSSLLVVLVVIVVSAAASSSSASPTEIEPDRTKAQQPICVTQIGKGDAAQPFTVQHSPPPGQQRHFPSLNFAGIDFHHLEVIFLILTS
ncbi:unnamed protein product [Protopolystoma xenopodis]|uniref:Uncharacterized protein n=1 Tax=Protopolystoma xenopodis TaxID=117903 RepID=A0A448XE90_9PLAT|nr:unnamed protein product [Protopolystoma xenopodis]